MIEEGHKIHIRHFSKDLKPHSWLIQRITSGKRNISFPLYTTIRSHLQCVSVYLKNSFIKSEKVHEKQQGPSAAKKKINKFPQTELPYDLAIPLLGTYPEEKRKLQFKNKQYSQ